MFLRARATSTAGTRIAATSAAAQTRVTPRAVLGKPGNAIRSKPRRWPPPTNEDLHDSLRDELSIDAI